MNLSYRIAATKHWFRMRALHVEVRYTRTRNQIENWLASRGGSLAQYVFWVRRRRTRYLKTIITPDVLTYHQFEELIIRQPLFWSSVWASNSYTSRSDILTWLATANSVLPTGGQNVSERRGSHNPFSRPTSGSDGDRQTTTGTPSPSRTGGTRQRRRTRRNR